MERMSVFVQTQPEKKDQEEKLLCIRGSTLSSFLMPLLDGITHRMTHTDPKAKDFIETLRKYSGQVRQWIQLVQDTPDELRKVQVLAGYLRWGRLILDYTVRQRGQCAQQLQSSCTRAADGATDTSSLACFCCQTPSILLSRVRVKLRRHSSRTAARSANICSFVRDSGAAVLTIAPASFSHIHSLLYCFCRLV